MELRRRFRTLLVFLIIIISAFCLAGCQYFFSSTFPSYLAQVTAFANLTDALPSDNWDFSLDVLHNGTEEYVFLTAFDRYDPSNHRLYVYDPGLNLVATLDDSNLGRRAMVDVLNEFIIGEARLAPPDFIPAAYTLAGSDGYGVHNGTNNYILSNTGAGPYTLNLDEYNSTWTLTASSSVFISNTEFQSFRSAFHDPVSGQTCFFFSEDYDGAPLYVYIVPDTTIPALTDPILSDPAVFLIPSVSREKDAYFFTGNAVVVQSVTENFEVYALDGSFISEFPGYNIYNRLHSFSVTGNYYYVFDESRRQLFQCETWW
jgi:hypothetical protein